MWIECDCEFFSVIHHCWKQSNNGDWRKNYYSKKLECISDHKSLSSIVFAGKWYARNNLISFSLTGPEYYAIWSRSMKIWLVRKIKLGFVDGRHKKDKFDESMHKLWKKCSTIVLSWIMNDVSKELLSGIV